jgi:hypothetical protein
MSEEIFIGPLELTVGELKKALDKYPDTMPIYADGETVPEEKDFNSILLSESNNPGSVSILFLTVGLAY